MIVFGVRFYFIDKKVNVPIAPNMAVQQKLHHHRKPSQSQHHQQKWQNEKRSSDGYDTNSVAPKYTMTQPAFGSSDKLLGTKCELNKSASNDNDDDHDHGDQRTECDVIETSVFHRHRPLNDPTVVDSTNRTASGLM